jgi:phosphonate transport system substrate-binding protein
VRAAWLDPQSASGYLFPRVELLALGVTFSNEQFFLAPERVALAVLSGDADVGASYLPDPTVADPLRAGESLAEVLGPKAENLRAIHVTDQIPPAGFVVSPGVKPEEAQRITSSLAAMHRDAASRDALLHLCHADRLVPVTDSLRETLRSWTAAAISRLG